MFGGRWSRSRLPIGIDVGSHAVRMVQLERTTSGGGFQLAAAARLGLPAAPGGGEAFHAAAGEAIRRMLAGGGFAGRRAVSCLPSAGVQYKNMRLPKMPADELPRAVEWEAADRLHLGRDASTVQYYNAGEVRQGDDLRQEIILLATTHLLVEQHTAMLVSCGLDPVAIDVVPSGLAACAERWPATSAAPDQGCDEASVVIDVGHSGTNVLIVRRGRIIFFKHIAVGSHNMDQAVAAALNLPVQQGGSLRRDINAPLDGTTERDPAVVDAATQAVRPVLADLGREIGLCLRYYSVTFRGRRPAVARLVGGEARSATLATALTDAAGITVEPIDPFIFLEPSPARSLVGEPASRGEWAVAIGLSLRGDARARPGAKGAAA
jgi:type IV pilus assembly protein PilM